MKINNIGRLWEAYDSKKSYNVEKSSKTSDKKDVFTLSDTAKDFQATLKAVSSAPDIRQDKVAEVKKRFNSSSYNVSSEEIADKILNNQWS